ncbi:MAG TPA: hypothetical protein VHR41_04355 [Gemmatimonadales bacterium]|jgi:hypothetical protein|nr:hypothetical protein [Gemmatimonadales bacterium]
MAVRATVALAFLLGTGAGPLAGQNGIQDVTDQTTTARTQPSTRPPAARPAPARPAPPRPDTVRIPASAPDSSFAMMQRLLRRGDSLQSLINQKMPADAAALKDYRDAASFAWWIMGIWLALTLLYILWAINRYVSNYGLSNREWKILYPEIYETWLDRLLTGLLGGKSYRERRDELIAYRKQQRLEAANITEDGPAAPAASDVEPFEEPQKNPYEQDSFGLPPGTIRGMLALSGLVVFVVMECVNLYAPGSLEPQFQGLVTAFQMVLAFYFGSRAVEVLQTKAAEAQVAVAAESKPVVAVVPAQTGGVPAGSPTDASVPVAPAAVILPAEAVQLPASRSQVRFANFVAAAKDDGSAPASAAGRTLTQSTPLGVRVLALTASFETGRGFPDCFGGVAGNFDHQGLSWGALQWNIGQGTLQSLWKEMRERNEAELRTILGTLYDEFSRMLDRPKEEQMRWALGIQSLVANRANTWRIADNWKSSLSAMGKSEPMIAIQVARADAFLQIALGFCRDYGLTTERGAALMFDIRVQNGSVDRGGAGEQIRRDIELINPALSPAEQEVERMRIVARRRAGVSAPAWRADVLARKLTIAEGKGRVHGRTYDVEAEFGLGLTPLARPASAPIIA